MDKRNGTRLVVIALFAVALVVALGWNMSSSAQLMKGRSGSDLRYNYGEFASLLGKHGDKGMLLEVHIARIETGKGEVIGKLVHSTDAFLIMKAQNGRDLQVITWDDVIWIGARPN